MGGIWSVIAVASLAVVLSGCSAATKPSPSSPPLASVSASPSAAANARPSLALDGKCASALTESEVSAAVGATVTLKPSRAFADTWSVQQLGGIACTWANASKADLLWVTIIPAAAAGAQVAKQNDGQPNCYGGDVAVGQSDACSFGTVIGPWWFAGVAYTAEGSHLRSKDAIASLTSALSPRLAAADARVPSTAPGTWSTALDCDVVAKAADLATVLGDPALVGGRGNGGAELGPGVYGALAATGYRSCMWDDGSSPGPNAFTIEVIPGGAWVLTQGGLVGATRVDVAGAVSAMEAPVPGASGTYLYVSDGINLLVLAPNTSVAVSSLTPAVAPLLRALAG